MAEELKGKTGNDSQNANGKNAVNSEDLYNEVIKVLKNCYDPEIPVNIYELGLIYDIKIAENNDVLVIMTLTSPACPVAGSLPIEIQDKLREHPMINDARVEITFDPPWSFDNMSEEAKYELGFI
jgi:FeS assembly SUF system protein